MSNETQLQTHPWQALHQKIGNRATARLINRSSDGPEQQSPPKLAGRQIDPVGSPRERDAERISAQAGGTAGRQHSTTEYAAKGPSTTPRSNRLPSNLSTRGTPLIPSVRAQMESRFGQDFGDVRVHTGDQAARATRAIDAKAFTAGRDIVFAEDQYAPHRTEGRALLAHELTHVVQQTEATANAGVASLGETSPVVSGDQFGPIQTQASSVLQRQEGDVDPEIANLPANRYVDTFTDAYYDLSYRAEGGNLSTWLTLEYGDGTLIDVNIYEFVETTIPPEDVTQAMRRGYVGIGGRIFPEILTPQTAPRLWAARQAAIDVMEESNYEFILSTLPAVLFILSLTGSAMPATGGATPRATARPAPRSQRVRVRSRQSGRSQSTSRQQSSSGSQTGRAAAGETAATTTARQGINATRHARGSPALGGFKSGMSADEIVTINRQFGGTTMTTGHPSSALAAASRYDSFWKKAAAIVREVAGRHMFDNGNKRTAAAIVNELRRRNQVWTGVEGAQLRRVIGQVVDGSLSSIDDIATALRGF